MLFSLSSASQRGWGRLCPGKLPGTVSLLYQGERLGSLDIRDAIVFATKLVGSEMARSISPDDARDVKVLRGRRKGGLPKTAIHELIEHGWPSDISKGITYIVNSVHSVNPENGLGVYFDRNSERLHFSSVEMNLKELIMVCRILLEDVVTAEFEYRYYLGNQTISLRKPTKVRRKADKKRPGKAKRQSQSDAKTSALANGKDLLAHLNAAHAVLQKLSSYSTEEIAVELLLHDMMSLHTRLLLMQEKALQNRINKIREIFGAETPEESQNIISETEEMPANSRHYLGQLE